MKQEFTTVRGKLIVERNRLRIRNIIPVRNNDLYWMALQGMLCVFMLQKSSPADVLGYIGLSFLGIFILVTLIESVFFKVLRNHFALEEIASFTVRQEYNGLQTMVTLKLKNGRKKDIFFRTLEKQHDSFLELISQHEPEKVFA